MKGTANADLAGRLSAATGLDVVIYTASGVPNLNIYFDEPPFGEPPRSEHATEAPIAPTHYGFAGFDLVPGTDRLLWRSLSVPEGMFAAVAATVVGWARELGYTRWEALPEVSPRMRSALMGMGFSPDLHLDLERSTILDLWLADHSDPFHDLFRPDAKETFMEYTILDEAARAAILNDRILALESDHYRNTIELLAQPKDSQNIEALTARVADLEGTLGALRKEQAKLSK